MALATTMPGTARSRAAAPEPAKLGVPMPGLVLGHLISILFRADLAAVVEGRQSLVYWIDNPDVAGMFVAVNNTNRWNFHVAYHPDMGESVCDFTEERCTEIVLKAVGLPVGDRRYCSLDHGGAGRGRDAT
jgi:putative polyketide hydroxylase